MNKPALPGPAPVSASRLPPARIASISIGGVHFAPICGTAEGAHGQVGGLLAAYRANGTVLWSMKVYDNKRRDDLEGDVQDVFFRSMDVRPDGRLLIVNEDGRRFLVDVNARTSTPLPIEVLDDDDGLRP